MKILAGTLITQTKFKLNIQINYRTQYNEKVEEEKEFDLVLECTGQKYNSNFLNKNFSSSQAKNG